MVIHLFSVNFPNMNNFYAPIKKFPSYPLMIIGISLGIHGTVKKVFFYYMGCQIMVVIHPTANKPQHGQFDDRTK